MPVPSQRTERSQMPRPDVTLTEPPATECGHSFKAQVHMVLEEVVATKRKRLVK